MDTPFFTVVILVRDLPHLLPVTIESVLTQSFQKAEIIVVEAGLKNQIMEQISGFGENIQQIYSASQKDLSCMMNHGLHFAKGKYLHFLYSGDYYLSDHSLKDLHDFITQNKQPDFICSLFLKREEQSKPTVFSLPIEKEILKKGKIFGILQSFLFSTSFLQKSKGFNERYRCRPLFDFFSSLFLKKKFSYAFFNKVIFDYEIRKKDLKTIFCFTLETFLIIYRYFGLFACLIWWFSKDRYALLKLSYYSVKKIFCKPH